MTDNRENRIPGAEMPREMPLFGTAAILAGGRSSRMGFDKQLLMEDDRRILERVVETLKTEFPDILIVTARPELYEGMGVRVCGDTYRDKGPLAGVHAALEQSRSRYVYLLACDMPILCPEFIRYMKERIEQTGADICVGQKNDRLEPFNTFYSRALLPEVTHRLQTGNASLFRFIYASRTCVISAEEAARFDKELAMFTNLNTRTEFEKYLGTTAGAPEDGTEALVDKLDILRYIGGEFIQLRDLMVHEKTLVLTIEGIGTRTLYCSPSELRELAAGHLLTEGYIRTREDIVSLELDEEAGKADIVLAAPGKKLPAAPLTDRCVFDPEILLANQQRFYDGSTVQKATAGTHRCALCDDSGTIFSSIDISRHNCIDKIAGKALLRGVSLGDKYLLTSGRIPMDMIRKAAALGVPMIVSRSTPTIAAVETARAANITLLGFSRENRFNIYSAPQRLKGCTLPIPQR